MRCTEGLPGEIGEVKIGRIKAKVTRVGRIDARGVLVGRKGEAEAQEGQ